MRTLLYSLLFVSTISIACNSGETNTTTADATSEDVTKTWKLGVALWTFHTFSFPESLIKADSSGLKYIEPNTFAKAGPELKDSMILKLSPSGIEKLKALIEKQGLTTESLYIVGDSTIESWKKQFDIAKMLGVKFVTTEPPIKMWDSIDSLAGVYGIKVAIHEHWKGTSAYWNPDTVLMAIKGHPNFGACADLGHWPKSGIDPVEAVKKLSGHIISLHLKDISAFNDPTLKDVPVGKGVVNFPAVFAELKKQNFQGNIYIEMDIEELPSNLPSVIQTVKYYNEEIAKLK